MLVQLGRAVYSQCRHRQQFAPNYSFFADDDLDDLNLELSRSAVCHVSRSRPGRVAFGVDNLLLIVVRVYCADLDRELVHVLALYRRGIQEADMRRDMDCTLAAVALQRTATTGTARARPLYPTMVEHCRFHL